jgi:hypothetical protein
MTVRQKYPAWVYLRFGKDIAAETWRATEAKRQQGQELTVQEKLILRQAANTSAY